MNADDKTLAQLAVDRFVRRFGNESYRQLAFHAALPFVLTPELLNYLRHTFLRGLNPPLPWVAEADFLLSDLCDQVGYEQYAMKQVVRDYLMAEMRQRLGDERLEAVARLLLRYVNGLKRGGSAFSMRELQTQELGAMLCIYDQRVAAVRELAKMLQSEVASAASTPDGWNQGEMARLARLTLSLSAQLSEYPALLRYAAECLRELGTDSANASTTASTKVLDIDLPAVRLPGRPRQAEFAVTPTPAPTDTVIVQLAFSTARVLLAALVTGTLPRTDVLLEVQVALTRALGAGGGGGKKNDGGTSEEGQAGGGGKSASLRRGAGPGSTGDLAEEQETSKTEPQSPLETDKFLYDVYVSYSSIDREWVREELLPRLKQAGLRVFIDTTEFRFGSTNAENMEYGAANSRTMLTVLTPAYFQSEWASYETLLMATGDPAGHDPRIIPLLLEPCEMPPRFAMLAYIDFTNKDSRGQAMDRLLHVLTTTAGRGVMDQPTAVAPDRPDVFDAFIHYDRGDFEWVSNFLVPNLESAGLKILVDYRDFEIGVPIMASLERAIRDSRHTVIVMTPAWVSQQWSQLEPVFRFLSDPSRLGRRLIPLLLTPCDLPRPLRVLVYADFTEPKEWPQQVDRLVRRLRFPGEALARGEGTAAEASEIVANDKETLADLMRVPGFEADVAAIGELVSSVRADVELLRQYTYLHDLLHELEAFGYTVLLREIKSFPDATNRENLQDLEFTLQRIIDRARELPVAQSEPWISSISQARDAVREARRRSDPGLFERAERLLNRVLRLEPSRLNYRMVELAASLRLPALVQAFQHLGSDQPPLAAGDLVGPEKWRRIQTATEVLAALNNDLRALVEEHDRWQVVADELRLLEASLGHNERDLERSWPHIQTLVEPLYRKSRKFWAVSLQADAEQLGSALAVQDPARIRESFRRFRRRAADRFAEVDRELLRLCDRLFDALALLQPLARSPS